MGLSAIQQNDKQVVSEPYYPIFYSPLKLQFLNYFNWSSNIVSPYGMWPGVCIRSGFVHTPLLPVALLWATINGFTNKFCIQETMSWCLFSFLHHFILVYIRKSANTSEILYLSIFFSDWRFCFMLLHLALFIACFT